jgi:hypothetical protein
VSAPTNCSRTLEYEHRVEVVQIRLGDQEPVKDPLADSVDLDLVAYA